MKLLPSAIIVFMLAANCAAQTEVWHNGKKWGVREGSREIIPPVYDTVFGYDSTGRVCLACQKINTTGKSQFIKVKTVSYTCNYFDKNGQRFLLRNRSGDTCGVFSLSSNSVEQYRQNEIFAVSAKTKKFLVTKDLRQLTFRGYHSVSVSPDQMFYVTVVPNEAETMLTGVVNKREEPVVPNSYTSIRFNPFDSLIVACSAGLNGTTDDIFTYEGKRIASYNRHVDQVTRNFVIHKIFDPSEYYIIYNPEKQIETRLVADELQLHDRDTIKIRVRNEWFIYDMRSSEKKPLKQT